MCIVWSYTYSRSLHSNSLLTYWPVRLRVDFFFPLFKHLHMYSYQLVLPLTLMQDLMLHTLYLHRCQWIGKSSGIYFRLSIPFPYPPLLFIHWTEINPVGVNIRIIFCFFITLSALPFHLKMLPYCYSFLSRGIIISHDMVNQHSWIWRDIILSTSDAQELVNFLWCYEDH